MNSERWHDIERVLDGVFNLKPNERDAYLKEACAGDDELRREVQTLLEAEARAPSFLEQDAAAFAAPELQGLEEGATGLPVEPGQQLGPYRLIREIGHGGMSVVFLAERDDEQFKRQVAIKLLRHMGGDRATQIRRFEVERQILASLNHPYIAQMYDGGVTDGGWPYLVMEQIDGVPITDYCVDNHLDIKERVQLFGQVCDALVHAHRRLIVHRDLKPSNILVTRSGEVKLLDFGIAKLLSEDDLLVNAPLTRTGMQMMTPEYAAPEQVRGETITTATDVYALGVVLYELLTHQRPRDFTGKTLGEMEQLICESNPPKPSTAVSTVRLRQLLLGDLDTIVLKALRIEPDARYESVTEFSKDLSRYLEGLPVQAREPTAGYRARKFMSRHRLGVAVSGAFVSVLLISAVLLALQGARTARERDRAAAEAAKSREVSDFVLGLFGASDPNESRGDTITARELLNRGVERADALADQPLVQAEMLAVMGSAYRSLGSYDSAEPLLQQALDLQREHGEEPAVAANLGMLGELFRLAGDWDASEEAHREALEIRSRLLADSDPAVADSMHSLGTVLLALARYDEAAILLTDALDRRQVVLNPEDPRIAVTINGLGHLRHLQGDYDTADGLFRDALVQQRRLLGEDHPDVETTLGNLAWNTYRRGDMPQAEELHRESLALSRKIHGDEHPSVASALANLAIVVENQGRITEAEALHRETLAMRRNLLGDEHPRTSVSLNNLAVCLYKQRRFDEAEPLYREVIDNKIVLIGEDHPSVANTLNNLGVLLERKGDLDAAETSHQRAWAIRTAALGEEHPAVGESLQNLGMVAKRKGDYDLARFRLQRALAIRRATLGDEHRNVGRTLSVLGEVATLEGDLEGAESLLLESIEILRQTVGEKHRNFKTATENLVALYETWGRPDEAARYAAMLDEQK